MAQASGISRRGADDVIVGGRVIVNGAPGVLGQRVEPDSDQISVNGKTVKLALYNSIVFNKPAGYVTSRVGQDNPTIYDLLPRELQVLKPAGRLDKDSSGLLILTNDGNLANTMIHPSSGKAKRYGATLNRPLNPADEDRLVKGIPLTEGISRIKIFKVAGAKVSVELVTGWNRQIRRTFEAVGYEVRELERLSIGKVKLGELESGKWRELTLEEAKWLAS